jgi:hypothetical protein
MSFADLYKFRNCASDNDLLLAHYTSLENVINIVRSEQLWMSHPLFMNDRHELDVGVDLIGAALLAVTEDAVMFSDYKKAVSDFRKLSKLDTYVLCFSKHSAANEDGMLSMWRGYGDQGRGACIVFNRKFVSETADDSILFLQDVEYFSNRERFDKAVDIVKTWLECRKSADNCYWAADYEVLVDRAVIYALTTKHAGFGEEKEIRIIYMKNRDYKEILKKYYDYNVGTRGVEVKLKLPINPLSEDSHDTWSFQDIVHTIIIGPAASSELQKNSLCRAFEKIGKQWLVERVRASSIPFRPHP